MLPPKPYRPSHIKFGLIPEQHSEHKEQVPVTIQTFTFYTLLAPFVSGQAEQNQTEKVLTNPVNNKSQAK